jgi:hypothetical protein
VPCGQLTTVIWEGPIPVAARSKALVCDCSLAGIAGSNPRRRGMDNCLLWMLCVVRGLCDGPITRPEESYWVCVCVCVCVCHCVWSDATTALCTYNADVKDFRLRKKENWEKSGGGVLTSVTLEKHYTVFSGKSEENSDNRYLGCLCLCAVCVNTL